MKKLLIGLLAAVVLIVAAILIVPSFVDWNAQKERIASIVHEATGRELTIVGDIEVTVLPRPALRVADVRFANVSGAAAPDMVRIQEARVSVAVSSFLKGRPAVIVTLIRPIVHLERLADGRTSWDFTKPVQPGSQAVGEVGRPRVNSGFSGLALDVKLDSFRMVNGTVTYLDGRTGAIERIDVLNSDISFDSLGGPFRMQGTGIVRDVPLALDVSTGMLRDGAPLPLSLVLTTPGGETTLRLRGNLDDIRSATRFDGDLLIESMNLAEFASSVASVSPLFLFGQAATIEGDVTVTPGLLQISAITGRFGNARFHGDVTAEVGDATAIKAVFKTKHLDLDHLIESVAASHHSMVPPRPQTSGGLIPGGEARADAGANGFILAKTLSADIEISADVIQYRGGLIRGTRLYTRLDDGRFAVEEATAVLPGNSSIMAQGTVGFEKTPPGIQFDIKAQSDNLREILEWVGFDTSKVPADRLRRFSFATQVTGDTQKLLARTIEARIDATDVDAGIALIVRERPAFGLRVAVDRLNLDGYMPEPDRIVGPGRQVSDGERTGSHPDALLPPILTRMIDGLHAFDANIDASIRQLTVSKTLVSDISLDFTVVNGGIELRNAQIGDFAGLRGQVSGSLQADTSGPSLMLDYEAEVRDQGRFMRFMGMPEPRYGTDHRSLKSSGRIAGRVDELSAEARLSGLDGSIELDGTLKDLALSPRFDLSLALKFPELVDLVRLGMPDYSPAAGKLGAVDLTLRADGTPASFALSAIDGNAGPVSLRGGVAVDLSGSRPKVQMGLSTSEILLDLFLPLKERARAAAPGTFQLIPAAARAGPADGGGWSSDPIDSSVLREADLDITLTMAALTKDPYRFIKPEIEARLVDGRFTLDRFASGFAGGSISAMGQVEPQGDGLAASVNFGAKDVELSDLVTALRDYQLTLGPLHFGARVMGPVTVNGALSAEGSSKRELVASMNGLAKISGQFRTDLSDNTRRAGAVADIAGAQLGEQRRSLRSITEVVQGTDALVSAFTGQSTLNGDLHIDRGVVSTQNTVLVGRGGRALTSGTASLTEWKLTAKTDVTLGKDSAPYLQVYMEGALDDPYVRRVSGALFRGQTSISTPSNPSDLPTGTGRALELLPGLQRQRSERGENDHPTNEYPRRSTPEEVLKGILQGVGR